MDLHKLVREGIEIFLNEVSEKGFKKLLLYGAGEVAEIILVVVKFGSKCDIEIIALVDYDLGKWGTEVLGFPAISSADIKKYEHDGIFISSYTYEETIKQQLIKKGYKKEKIITFFAEN